MICKRGPGQDNVQMIYTCLHLSKQVFSCRERLKYYLSVDYSNACEFKVWTIVWSCIHAVVF